MAHRLITPQRVVRSTRGFATADVVDGKTVHAQPALDVQPRHGGKAKGGVVAHSWGNTEQQIQQDGTRHLIKDAVDASSANPLHLMTSSQAGKRLPIPACHTGTPSRAERGSYDPSTAVLSEAKHDPADFAALPQSVKEN